MINNEVYRHLGERWYTANDDPIALLRAESNFRNPWILERIRSEMKTDAVKLVDLGCGGGFLSNFMAQNGVQVTGVDLANEALQVAREWDGTGTARYVQADVTKTSLPGRSADVVCAMDVLEHVENPNALVSEASRLLRPGGVFFFATFNRNFLSRFVVIHLVEWFIKNVPERLHEIEYFIKPGEMKELCLANRLQNIEVHGVAPKLDLKTVIAIARSGCVPSDFEFRFVKRPHVAYLGLAKKQEKTRGDRT